MADLRIPKSRELPQAECAALVVPAKQFVAFVVRIALTEFRQDFPYLKHSVERRVLQSNYMFCGTVIVYIRKTHAKSCFLPLLCLKGKSSMKHVFYNIFYCSEANTSSFLWLFCRKE